MHIDKESVTPINPFHYTFVFICVHLWLPIILLTCGRWRRTRRSYAWQLQHIAADQGLFGLSGRSLSIQFRCQHSR